MVNQAMRQANRKAAGPQRARAYLSQLINREIATRYEHAILGMSTLHFLAEAFEEVADVAIDLCENARIGKPRKPYPEKTLDREVWETVSAAARKLERALAASNGATGVRLVYASRSSNMRLTACQLAAFPKLLDALARQEAAQYGRANQVVRPIMIAKPSRKRMSLANALTIGLAHVFDQLKKGNLALRTGVVIKNCTAWNVAADFSQAATGDDVGDASSAKKALSDHKGHLIFIG